MKKVLAVSGGLDSMVLLHRFKDDPAAVVAHFNHGTRPSAINDEQFVKKATKLLGLPLFVGHANLGKNASEERARAARYEFLSKIAKDHQAKIYTAHHADDLLETIAINLLRGTGWRGLAPFSQPNVERPFLSQTKNQLRAYAAQHQIIYREDPTNNEEHYLRNRIRTHLTNLDNNVKTKLLKLFNQQTAIRDEIAIIIKTCLPVDGLYLRKWFKDLDDNIALEILRAALANESCTATRPQLQEFLQAIRTYTPGKQFNLPGDRLIKIHKDYFVIK